MNALFEFRQCITLLKATGAVAKNLRELRDLIATASDACLHHHTYQYFLKGHILEYTNDFAEWAGQYLEERELAEEFSNVDPYGFGDINSLRTELIRVMRRLSRAVPGTAGDEAGRRLLLQRNSDARFSRRGPGEEPGRVPYRRQICGREAASITIFTIPASGWAEE